MHADATEILGLIAGCIGAFAFAPQAVKILRQGEAESVAEEGDDPDGQQQLQPAADEDQHPDAHQFGEGELDADGEEEQDHADLGKLLDLMGVGNQAESGRSGDDAGQQEADHRRDEASQQGDGQQGQAEEDDEFREDGHGRPAAGVSRTAPARRG